MKRLKITVKQTTPPVLCAAGELDYKNCSRLERLIEDTRRSTSNGLLRLSLDGLDFVDSSGIRVLARAAHEAQASGGSIILITLTAQLRHALEITGFNRLFEIEGCAIQMETGVIAHPHVGSSSSFKVPLGMAAPRDIRDRVCDFAACLGFSMLAMDDIRLAIGEAISNAVRHGGASGSDDIHIECRADADRLYVQIRYPSEAFDPDEVPAPCFDPPCEGGMGIYFMRLVMDSVDYQFSGGLAILTLEKQAAYE